jgi:hypothetical protein
VKKKLIVSFVKLVLIDTESLPSKALFIKKKSTEQNDPSSPGTTEDKKEWNFTTKRLISAMHDIDNFKRILFFLYPRLFCDL